MTFTPLLWTYSANSSVLSRMSSLSQKIKDRRAERIAQDMIDEISEEISEFEADGISSYGDDYDEEDFEVDDYGRPSHSSLCFFCFSGGGKPDKYFIHLPNS